MTWIWQNPTRQTVGGSKWLLTAYHCSEGPQLAIDTTLVSSLHANGLPRLVGVDGAALQAARRRKERRYPELARRFARALLVVLAVEVCGRLSESDSVFPELIGPREGTF